MLQRFFIAFLFLFPLAGTAKQPVNDKQLRMYQDTLHKMDSAVFRGKDQQKQAVNRKFMTCLRKALNTEGAFDFPFDSLKTIGKLTAPDNSFRIFNWNIPNDDGTYTYYGFLMVNQAKALTGKKGRMVKDQYVIYELIDKSNEIRNPELTVCSPEKWYGALYYKIIKTSDKDKNYYTLLGWDGNNQVTWKKVIDVLTFDKQGNPIFGEKNLFQRGRRSSKRVIFEFRAEMVMTLHWDEGNNRIVYDHLAPEVAGAEGMYQYYSQTFNYDAFVWKKGEWKEMDDVRPNNPSDPKDKEYHAPEGDQKPKPNPAPKPPGGRH